jgi:hypothetical protein
VFADWFTGRLLLAIAVHRNGLGELSVSAVIIRKFESSKPFVSYFEAPISFWIKSLLVLEKKGHDGGYELLCNPVIRDISSAAVGTAFSNYCDLITIECNEQGYPSIYDLSHPVATTRRDS